MAFQRSAEGSNYNELGTPGALAVDGNRNPVFRLYDSCAYARARVWEELYWQVDLESPHVIYNLTVYGTDGNSAYDGKRL